MKTKQQKIDAIYEKIARKDLYRGDVFYVDNNEMIFIKKDNKNIEYLDYYEVVVDRYNNIISDNTFKFKGGPVMIGDVMDYLDNLPPEELLKIIEETEKLFYIWKYKRKPIEEQSDDCVDFVYDLISEQGEK